MEPQKLNTILAFLLSPVTLHRQLSCQVSEIIFKKQKFIGVVPAIKPAAKLSETKKIALLATPATVERQYTDNLIRDFACDCEVFRLGDEALAKEAEKKLTGEVIDEKLLHEILSPLKNKEIDTVVLGCTHYPLIVDELRGFSLKLKIGLILELLLQVDFMNCQRMKSLAVRIKLYIFQVLQT